MNKYLTPLIATALMASAAGMTSCQKTTDNSPKSEISAPADSLFNSIFASDNEAAPGAVILVARGDSIVYNRAYGYSDLEQMIPNSDTTLFCLCSISKQFSAVALLKLQEMVEDFDLNDSLPKYFPQFKADFFNKVKLKHLLSHTSGIPDTRPRTKEEWNEYLKHNESFFANVRDYKLFALCRESTRYMQHLNHLNFEPGTAYEYQNPTYQLILPLIEDMTGEKFPEWMEENIFKPAGLKSATYLNPTIKQPQLSHAYRHPEGHNRYNTFRTSDGIWEEYDYGQADFFPTKSDGGLYCSPLEFFRWQKALFSEKIINLGSIHQAIAPVVSTGEPHNYYGLGFFLDTRGNKPRKIYHTGDNGGYLCVEAYFPELDLFYLIFSNRNDWDRDGTMKKFDKILESKGWI